MIENYLAETGRIKLTVERLHADARRLAQEPGGTPDSPAEALAAAEDVAEALAEAAARATKLYGLTPPPWKVAQEEARHV